MAPSARTPDEVQNANMEQFRIFELRHLKAMMGPTHRSLSVSQENYKKYFDEQVKTTVQLVEGRNSFLHKASKATQ